MEVFWYQKRLIIKLNTTSLSSNSICSFINSCGWKTGKCIFISFQSTKLFPCSFPFHGIPMGPMGIPYVDSSLNWGKDYRPTDLMFVSIKDFILLERGCSETKAYQSLPIKPPLHANRLFSSCWPNHSRQIFCCISSNCFYIRLKV